MIEASVFDKSEKSEIRKTRLKAKHAQRKWHRREHVLAPRILQGAREVFVRILAATAHALEGPPTVASSIL